MGREKLLDLVVGDRLSGLGEHRQRAADRNLGPFSGDDSPDDPVPWRDYVVSRLVGLGDEQRVTGADTGALSAQPLGNRR